MWFINGVVELIGSVIGASGAVLLIVYFGQNLITERLKQSIKYEYDAALETLKAELLLSSNSIVAQFRAEVDQRLGVQGAASATLTAMHSASSPRRIQAVMNLWEAILSLRDSLPGLAFVYEQMHSTVSREGLKALGGTPEDTNPDRVMRVFSERVKKVETERLLVGDKLWAIFTAYGSLWMYSGIACRSWFDKDPNLLLLINAQNIQRLLKELIDVPEVATFVLDPSARTSLRTALEHEFLTAAAKVIHGETSAEFGFHQARKIMNLADELRPATANTLEAKPAGGTG